MENEDKKTMQLQTKVTPEVYARLEAIGKQFGTSIYEILRLLSDCIIRFMDDRHNLSDDLVRIIRMFEDLPGWHKSICLADGLQDMEIIEAFYVLSANNDPNGCRLVLVERPMLNGDPDGWIATYNIQRMVERFMEIVSPSLYKHLRMLAVDMGTDSMLDTIHRIADLYRENPDEKELRLQFEQNDWHKGAKMHEENQYKRGYGHSMDYMETQQKLFDEDN